MRIACLGWGSLIWDDPCELPLSEHWEDDGPLLPLEFARESNGGRMTLVITKGHQTLPSLWNILSSPSLEAAKTVLANRECIPDKNISYSIGYWENETGSGHGLGLGTIRDWAKAKKLDAVVWTNLKFGFKNSRDQMPTLEQVVEYLRNRSVVERDKAKEYVIRAPGQIATSYRGAICEQLGWDA